MEEKYYELHVTVATDRVLLFTDFCKSTGAKPLYIQLDEGLHKNQLMVAVTKMLPDDIIAKQWARVYESYLDPHFTILRNKLESRLIEGPNEYYEAHWKLDLRKDEHFWRCTLNEMKKKHPYLLISHNLLDTRIHYVSQRIYGSLDPVTASEKFAASGDILKEFYALPLVKTHYERCVWDSNPALDFGWS